MHQLTVDVVNCIATGNQGRIVCGNSNYKIKFNFDSEWDGYETKTALFRWGNKFEIVKHVPFSGSECEVPRMLDTVGFKVGVYSGDKSTTTPAYFGADPCILCGVQKPDDPKEDVYDQLIAILNDINENIGDINSLLETI